MTQPASSAPAQRTGEDRQGRLIEHVQGRQILDSRGHPTVAAHRKARSKRSSMLASGLWSRSVRLTRPPMAGRSTMGLRYVVLTVKDRCVTEMKGCASRQVAVDYTAN